MAEKDQLRKQRTQLRAELEAAEAKHREIKLAFGEAWAAYRDGSRPIGTVGPLLERVALLLGYEGFKVHYK
jgi:hypothetical protein